MIINKDMLEPSVNAGFNNIVTRSLSHSLTYYIQLPNTIIMTLVADVTWLEKYFNKINHCFLEISLIN